MKHWYKQNPIVSVYSFMRNAWERDPAYSVGGAAMLVVPKWLKNPRGKYYLYSASSRGTYIRMNVADDVAGPYHTQEDGVLHMDTDVKFCKDHMLGPSILVDDDTEELVMYFRCNCKNTDDKQCDMNGEVVFAATSKDGYAWKASHDAVTSVSASVVKIGSFYYLFNKDTVYYSEDKVTGWKSSGKPANTDKNAKMQFPSMMVVGNKVVSTWSNREADTIDYAVASLEGKDLSEPLTGDFWSSFGNPAVLVRQTEEWEKPLHGGNAVKDPTLFKDHNGHIMMTYTVAADTGIGLALIEELEKAAGGADAAQGWIDPTQ